MVSFFQTGGPARSGGGAKPHARIKTMSVKHIWTAQAGWNNLSVGAEIEALIRPLIVAKFGKVAEGARFSINKRAGDVVIGVADEEIARLRKATDKANKAAGDAAMPAANASLAALQEQVAALMAALGQAAPAAPAEPAKRGRKPRAA